MTWGKFGLDDTVLKTTQDLRLWQTEKGVVEIRKDAVAVPILQGEDRKGYVFHGRGKLLLDAIVETDEGALGKSIETELNEPFLMLGDIEPLEKDLTQASQEDFTKIGYESQQRFVEAAKDLLDRFFRGRTHYGEDFDVDQGLVFAFPEGAGDLDILVAKGSKLVYKAKGLAFVSKGDKVVLKNPSQVVIANNRKLIVVKNGNSLIMKKCRCMS